MIEFRQSQIGDLGRIVRIAEDAKAVAETSEVTSEVATGTRATLEDPDPPAGAAFYRIVVSVP